MSGRARVAAFVLLLTLGVAPSPSVAATPAPPSAAGTTTFASTRGGIADLTLPRPVRFTLTASLTIPEISVEPGAGRITGIVLAQQGIRGDRGAALYAFRFNGCWSRACRTPADERLFPWTMAGSLRAGAIVANDGSQTMTLPAGRYRAYVVADGAPVQVRVRFAGFPGARTVAARTTATAALTSAESRFAGGPATHALYSAGATGRITSGLGVAVAAMEARSTMHVNTVSGACHFANSEPPGGTFAPGCPGGAPESMIVLRSIAPIHHGVLSVTFLTGPNDWTKGVYLDGVDVREYVSPTALLWLSLT